MYPRNRNEALEASLKESLTVNPLLNNKTLHQSLSTEDNPLKPNFRGKKPSPSLVKTSQSVHKGRTSDHFSKYLTTNIPLGLEQKTKPKPTKVKKRSSTLDFIEKLKQIEATTEKSGFLEQANEEIDIASRQLDEIQKLIARKMLEQEEARKSKFVVAESCDEEARHYRQSSIIDKCNKQLDRMQKQYLNKTRIRYKSLQDFENVTISTEDLLQEEKEPVRVLYAKDHEQFSLDFSDKDLKNAGPLLQKHVKSVASDHQIPQIPKPDPLKKEAKKFIRHKEINKKHMPLAPEKKFVFRYSQVTEAVQADNDRVPSQDLTIYKGRRKVRFEDTKVKSILRPDHFVPLDDLDLSDSQSETEESSKALVRLNDRRRNRERNSQDEGIQTGQMSRFDNRHRSKLTTIDESALTPDCLSPKDNVGDRPDLEKNSYNDGRRKLDLLLNGEDKDDVLEDAKLEESVLRSAYLSKEFSEKGFSQGNKDKSADKGSVQLLETVLHKFRERQPRQAANLKRRDRKLYTTLNSALKGTLYSEIKK